MHLAKFWRWLNNKYKNNVVENRFLSWRQKHLHDVSITQVYFILPYQTNTDTCCGNRMTLSHISSFFILWRHSCSWRQVILLWRHCFSVSGAWWKRTRARGGRRWGSCSASSGRRHRCFLLGKRSTEKRCTTILCQVCKRWFSSCCIILCGMTVIFKRSFILSRV